MNGYPSRSLNLDEARAVIPSLKIDDSYKQSYPYYDLGLPKIDKDGHSSFDPLTAKFTVTITQQSTARVAKPYDQEGWCYEIRVTGDYLQTRNGFQVACFPLRKSILTGKVFGIDTRWGQPSFDLNWQ